MVLRKVIWKMNSLNIRKLLSNVFQGYNAYFGDNTGELIDNYKINYQLPNSLLLEGQRTYRLEIDIWSNDTMQADILADEIENILNYTSRYNCEWATFILENRYNADEKSIYRRTLVYEVRTY